MLQKCHYLSKIKCSLYRNCNLLRTERSAESIKYFFQDFEPTDISNQNIDDNQEDKEDVTISGQTQREIGGQKYLFKTDKPIYVYSNEEKSLSFAHVATDTNVVVGGKIYLLAEDDRIDFYPDGTVASFCFAKDTQIIFSGNTYTFRKGVVQEDPKKKHRLNTISSI